MLTEVHELKSERVGASFEISVGRCTFTHETPTEILVVTDAVFQYGAAMDIAQALLLTQRFVPLLVIGVGYPGAGTVPQTLAERQRDLTPTAVEGREPSGGAEPLLGFLRDELSPWLVDRYGVGAVGGSCAGVSLGGLFGAWVLLHEPSLFRRYCLDPALADRRCRNLRLELLVQAGESHLTGGLVNLSRGLRYLFDHPG
jgi:uncharacterized protein